MDGPTREIAKCARCRCEFGRNKRPAHANNLAIHCRPCRRLVLRVKWAEASRRFRLGRTWDGQRYAIPVDSAPVRPESDAP